MNKLQQVQPTCPGSIICFSAFKVLSSIKVTTPDVSSQPFLQRVKKRMLESTNPL